MVVQIHLDYGLSGRDGQLLQVPLPVGFGDARVQLLPGTDLGLQHTLRVADPRRVRHRLAALHLYSYLLSLLRVLLVVRRLPVDVLPDLGDNQAPVLQLLHIELVDGQVRLWVLLLPPDRIKVSTELGQPIELDRSHLLLTI